MMMEYIYMALNEGNILNMISIEEMKTIEGPVSRPGASLCNIKLNLLFSGSSYQPSPRRLQQGKMKASFIKL